MGLAQVKFAIPEDVIFSLNVNIDEFTSKMKLFMALHLFKSHKLTLGKAAKLAGIDRDEFIIKLDRFQIPLIDYEPEELEKELERFGQ